MRNQTDGRRPRRCRTRYLWWPYAKNCIRAYPDRKQQAEKSANADPDAEPDIDRGPPRPVERKVLLMERKTALRLSGEKQTAREYCGVRQAVMETAELPDGTERLALIDMVYWRGTHTIAGAALQLHVSERTAQRWNGTFIRLVGVHLGFLDRLEAGTEPEDY